MLATQFSTRHGTQNGSENDLESTQINMKQWQDSTVEVPVSFACAHAQNANLGAYS